MSLLVELLFFDYKIKGSLKRFVNVMYSITEFTQFKRKVFIYIISYNIVAIYRRSSRPEAFCKKSALRKIYLLLAKFIKKFNFIKKETLPQLFSCEFCGISKNTFSYRTPLAAASVYSNKWVNASSFMDRRFGLTILTFCRMDYLLFLKFEQ